MSSLVNRNKRLAFIYPSTVRNYNLYFFFHKKNAGRRVGFLFVFVFLWGFFRGRAGVNLQTYHQRIKPLFIVLHLAFIIILNEVFRGSKLRED